MLLRCRATPTPAQAHPRASPPEVADAIVRAATPGQITDGRMLPGTPNLLLFSAAGQLDQLPQGEQPGAAAAAAAGGAGASRDDRAGGLVVRASDGP
jgi:hypothetical protein